MGEHKHNMTAIKAKNGELPPKKKPMSNKETENLLQMYIRDKLGIDRLYKETGIDERY